ncbi:hypothetical protein KY290_010417 [Solanum tuberosum]|uniref:Uncharacterized protein n=1 Tax=Solanum tuberosum TaxID=4113 RepID=A0ABQ7VZS6_SOLTU|nr:hypothetical protein KY290_010417 [Solanum tuberosum]
MPRSLPASVIVPRSLPVSVVISRCQGLELLFPVVDGGSHRAYCWGPARGRGRARARGCAHGVASGRGCARGEAPTRGRAKEASPEPYVEAAEDQVPPEFGDPLFQETLLSTLYVSHPSVVPAPAVGAQIAHEVILTAANQ